MKKIVAVAVAMMMAVAAMAMEWKSESMAKYLNPLGPVGSIESFQWKSGNELVAHLMEEKVLIGYEAPTELEDNVGYGIAPQSRCGKMKAKDIDKMWNLDKSVDGDRAEVLVVHDAENDTDELVVVFYTVKKGKVKSAEVYALVELYIYN